MATTIGATQGETKVELRPEQAIDLSVLGKNWRGRITDIGYSDGPPDGYAIDRGATKELIITIHIDETATS